MADHSSMKLGKHEARHDARVPLLARYTAAFPPPPEAVDWTGKLAAIGMMGNDSLGDCTCAAVGHAVQVWTSIAKGAEVTLADSDVIALYEIVGHYVRGQANTDQGAVETDVLGYWLKNPVAGNALSAYAALEPGNLTEIKDAISLFGGCYIGLALPVSAQSQDIWAVPAGGPTGPGEPGSWGGHAVFVAAYDQRGLTCITWGALKRMTWEFWSTYCDEAYALLSPDWQASGNKAPGGADWSALVADMAALGAGAGPPKPLALTDAQLWLLEAAIQSKLDGLDEDSGAGLDTAALQKPWNDLLAVIGAPGKRCAG